MSYLVKQYGDGTKEWRKVSDHFNKNTFGENNKSGHKTNLMCRERYMQVLNPQIDFSDHRKRFSTKETQTLI